MRRPGIRRYGSVLPALALLAFACAVESGGQRLDAAGMQREISRAFAERDPLEQRLRLAELMRELNPENVSGAAEVFIDAVETVLDEHPRRDHVPGRCREVEGRDNSCSCNQTRICRGL